MAESRCSWRAVGWLGLVLSLAGLGCQLQVSWVDPGNAAPKPSSQSGTRPGESAQPIMLTSGAAGAPAVMPAGPAMGATVLPGPTPTPGPGSPPAPMPPPGCGHGGNGGPGGPAMPLGRGVPHELWMTSLPPYMIEPPDILLIDALRIIPRPPYVVQPLDVLIVRLGNPLRATEPIDGLFTVAPDGTISLGFSYGVVRVAGLTLEDVERAIRAQVSRQVKEPQIAVGLAQFRGVQQVRGEHLVRPDGTVSLGSYGCVHVTGLTLAQAKVAIERHLSQYVLDPEVAVDVFSYNSKVYYVISDGAGYGQQVIRFPITGKETVLDAIGNIGGIPPVGSKKKIWVARPTPADHACVQILPVDWNAIAQGGSTATNYQLFPGDRIYIQSDPLIRLDNTLAKIFAPIERILGITLLGSSVVNSFRSGGSGTGTGAFIATGF